MSNIIVYNYIIIYNCKRDEMSKLKKKKKIARLRKQKTLESLPAESCVHHPASPAQRTSRRNRRRRDQRRRDAVSLADAPTLICRTAAARSIVCSHLRDRRDTSERCGSRGHHDPLLFPTRRTRRAIFYEGACCPRHVSASRGHSPRSFSRARISGVSDRRPVSW